MEESEPKPGRQLTVLPSAKASPLVATLASTTVVPAIVADAGDAAAKRFLEFFAVTIRNKNTRTAYLHAASRFFAWCEHHRLGALDEIEPLHVTAYIEALGKEFEKPTVKQHLAAIRMLFDWLVTGAHDSAPGGGSRHTGQNRLSYVSSDWDYRLSGSRRHIGERPGHGCARKPAHDQTP
jgi:hypothetical protein